MTKEDLKLLRWYRKQFSGEEDLPCLKYTDSKFIACSKIASGPVGPPARRENDTLENLGCVVFKRYLRTGLGKY
jgi:hypothetical protein